MDTDQAVLAVITKPPVKKQYRHHTCLQNDGERDEIFHHMKEPRENPGRLQVCEQDTLIREFTSSLLDKFTDHLYDLWSFLSLQLYSISTNILHFPSQTTHMIVLIVVISILQTLLSLRMYLLPVRNLKSWQIYDEREGMTIKSSSYYTYVFCESKWSQPGG